MLLELRTISTRNALKGASLASKAVETMLGMLGSTIAIAALWERIGGSSCDSEGSENVGFHDVNQ